MIPLKFISQPETTLEQSREWVNENRLHGVICPCCDQIANVYRRNLHHTIIAFVAWLRIKGINDHHKYQTFLKENPRFVSGTYALSKHWKLADRKKREDDSTKQHSGLWKITKRGIQFIEGRIAVPEYLLIYNNKVIGQSETDLYLHEILKKFKAFNYEEFIDRYIDPQNLFSNEK